MSRKAEKGKQHTPPSTSPPSSAPVPAGQETYFALTPPWLLHLAVVLVLMAVTCVLYAGDLDIGYFILDDAGYVRDNPHIRGTTAKNLWFILSTPYFANYSPMHLFSYLMDHAVGGLDPWVFHLSSNLWAGSVAAGVYLVAFVLCGRRSVALAAALLFAVHPAHVEAVAWISSRKDLVAAAFALPAIACHFLFRRGGANAGIWYWLSFACFALAVAGKLSVIVVPGILFLFDLIVEKRRDIWLWLNPIPYGLVAFYFLIRVWGAQPPTRHGPDVFVWGHTTLQNFWLLTGLGDYVLQRGRPDPESFGVWATAITFAPALIAAVPVGLYYLAGRWRRSRVAQDLDKATALFCWMILALVPAQALSFIHPVADRYLFFPSAAFVILLAWGLGKLAARGLGLGIVSVAIGATLCVAWASTTWAYVEEWRDPRSVWFAAKEKSQDAGVYLLLGTHYENLSDQVPSFATPRRYDPGQVPIGTRVSKNVVRATGAALATKGTLVTRSLRRRLETFGGRGEIRDVWAAADGRPLANLVWQDDERLQSLLEEWDAGKAGPETRAFQAHLRKLAKAELQTALKRKGKRVLPNLYFRLGKIAWDTQDFEEAIQQFRTSYRESRKHTSALVRDELAVRCHYAIAVTYWHQKSYEEALENLRKAEAEQERQGRKWIPEIAEKRKQLERLLENRS